MSVFTVQDLEHIQAEIDAFSNKMQNFGVDSCVVLVVAGTPDGHSLSWAQRGNHYSCIGSAQRWLDKALDTRPDKEDT